MTVQLPDIGQEAQKGIVAAFNDLFGPAFREFGLYLADKVRFHRENALRKIALRAKEISEEMGEVGPAEMPAIKFLIPFMEAASLEEEDEMVDLWAHLMISAGGAFSSKHILFKEVLSKINAHDAGVFEKIMIGVDAKDDMQSIAYPDEMINREFKTRWEKYDGDMEKFFSNIIECMDFSGHKLLSVGVHPRGGETVSKPIWVDVKSDIDSLEVLHQNGLVVLDVANLTPLDDVVITCTRVYMTRFGADFHAATHPAAVSDELF